MMLINSKRFIERMREMEKIGATPAGGVCRLALSKEDEYSRSLFSEWALKAGCTLLVDPFGNLFATKHGKNPDAPGILIGSHLDSQPTGGRFDGVLGVLAGLEVIESLNDAGVQPERSVTVVSWTNEEGARFAPAMLGSGAFSGIFSKEYTYSRTDSQGISFQNALKQIQAQGYEHFTLPIHAAFELHIEQGPVLEQLKNTIGVVTGIQGIRWYDVEVKGKETHAGPTPMSMRSDPIPRFSAFIQACYELGVKEGEEARITIGKITTYPGVRNTVPSTVSCTLDIRHPKPEVLHSLHQSVLSLSGKDENQVELSIKEVWHSPPVLFHSSCISAVQLATDVLGYSSHQMISGAGHDSAYVASCFPTSMIFIPCKDGLSHNEAEYASDEDCCAGANVLLHAVLNMLSIT